MMIKTFLKKLKDMRRGIRIIIGIFSIFLMCGGGASWADAVMKRHSDKEWMCTIWVTEPTLKPKEVFHNGVKEARLALSLEGGELDLKRVGHPALPFVEYQVLVPYGLTIERIDFDRKEIEKQRLESKVDFIPHPITHEDFADPVKKKAWELALSEDGAVYSTDDFYPAESGQYEQKIFRGYRIAYIKVTPFQYNPVQNELLFSRRIDCLISLRSETPEEHIPEKYIRTKPQDIAFLKRMVLNDQEIDSYLTIKKQREEIQ